MDREHALQLEESLRIPAAARTFEGFRKWVRTPAFPESGRIDFLAGDFEIDMSPEDRFKNARSIAVTHSLSCVCICSGP
jgi:hypothetical protein